MFVLSISPPTPLPSPPTPQGGGIKLPLTEDRDWRTFTLPNGLTCIVISDPAADTAGAAVAVSVGSFQDGPIPGLAHFLVHLLFMGCTTYPKENELSDFLSDHGGWCLLATTNAGGCDDTDFAAQQGW